MKSWTRSQKTTVLLTIAYAVVFISMLIVRKDVPRHFYDAFFNTYQIIPPLFAGIAGLIYYRFGSHSSPVRRVGWLLIAMGCLSFAVGQCTWTYLESFRNIEVPFPSWADAGYLGTYFLLTAGVLHLFGSMHIAGRARQLLDSAIVASSLGVLSWSFLVQRIWHQSDVPLIGKMISIAYPLGDILALFGAVVLISNARHQHALRRSLYFLAAGILGLTFFDTSFTWMSLNGTYQTGSWSDWTISFGWILMGYSFLTRMWWTGERTSVTGRFEALPGIRVPGILQIISPYIAVAVACAIVGIYDYTQVGTVKGSSVVAGVFLMTLVIGRQILALIENRSLTLDLKAFNSNLEWLVAQRTQELEAQNKTILEMVEERNRFHRQVSHEVRTPLTSVIGFAEVMMEDEDEPLSLWQKTQLQKVIGGAYRLLNMINDLLDISKVEAQRMEVYYDEVELDDLIKQVVDNITPLALEKALDIRVDVAGNPPVIITDEQKLAQILVNLLSNAIKYTPKGTINISAAFDRESVTIDVEDTGTGIPEEELDHIFKEFYRVQNGLVQKGSGLGLTIVQKLTDLIGGQVSVKSTQGAGSTFTLTLPLVPDDPCFAGDPDVPLVSVEEESPSSFRFPH